MQGGKMDIKRSRNNSIDIFRLYCAILVVAIHTHPFTELNEQVGFFVTNIMTRVAVPFFFSVSGFYYYENLKKRGVKAFAYTLRKLFKTYCIWSLIYSIINIIQYINSGANFTGIMYSLITDFFFYGSHYHFWYFIALFISITLITICYSKNIGYISYIGSLILYAIGVLGCSYWAVGNKIPIIRTIINVEYFDWIRKIFLMGLPFFALGCEISDILKSGKGLSAKIYHLLIMSILFLIEMYYVYQYDLVKNPVISICLYMLVATIVIYLIKHPLGKWGQIGKMCGPIASWTYYIHPLIILCLKKCFQPKNTPLFLLVCMISIISGYLVNLVCSCKKYFNEKY